MALRLADYVVSGEIINTRKNSVHGYLSLRGCDRAIVLQLTGNCDSDLAGKHIRFEARPTPLADPPEVTELELDEQRLAWMQIGVPGEMTANRQVRAFDGSTEEFTVRTSLGEQPPTAWKRCLYLEWYGQNGRTVVELVDPRIEFIEDDGASDLDSPEIDELESDDDLDAILDPGLPWADDFDDLDLEDEDDSELPDTDRPGISFELTDDGERDSWSGLPLDDEDDEDPYGLFPRDLEATLDAGTSDTPWYPAPDAETLAQWKEWDEVFDGSKDVPLSSLFDPPLKLPPADSLDDLQVATHLNSILMQLALHNIAFHMCEHYTPRAAYKLLVETILREHGAHPELPRIGYTMSFDTNEFCDECAAEFERGDAERRRNRSESGDLPDDLPDDDVPF